MTQIGTKPAVAGSTTAGNAASSGGASSLEQQVRAKIDSLSYLPTTVAVAMKFVELGKDAEAEPNEYAKVISSDSSLSTKLLSLANSSWFGVRNKVTKVQVAVNLLGLGTIRTLAISYCVTGLHNELRLTSEESKTFWSASLCKAVAAKQYAMLHDTRSAEEAFAAGLFQDFAIPVMFSTARDQIMPLLEDPELDAATRLTRERTAFRLDHAELARCVAQKLELPDLFVDAVAFHHSLSSLQEFAAKPVIAEATYIASLFPHLLNVWNRRDAEEMRAFLTQHAAGKVASPEAFLENVQKEFNELYSYFEQGEKPTINLAQLLEQATREAADNTTRLVGTVHELLQQAASNGRDVHTLLKPGQSDEAGLRDNLTGTLNRDGFTARAGDAVSKASRYGSTFAIAHFDVDKFKATNDAAGREHGDAVLQQLANIIQQNARPMDLVARIGADEFAILMNDCAEASAVQTAQHIVQAMAAAQPASQPGQQATVSAGMLWVNARGQACPLDKLLAAANALMLEARRAGGNRVNWRSLQAQAKPAAA